MKTESSKLFSFPEENEDYNLIINFQMLDEWDFIYQRSSGSSVLIDAT